MVAAAGEIVRLATTSAGAGAATSLQELNVLAAGPVQVPSLLTDIEEPIAGGLASLTLMLRATIPIAGPAVAETTPSYDMNSTTPPSSLTSAIPSLSFWSPLTP